MGCPGKMELSVVTIQNAIDERNEHAGDFFGGSGKAPAAEFMTRSDHSENLLEELMRSL